MGRPEAQIGGIASDRQPVTLGQKPSWRWRRSVRVRHYWGRKHMCRVDKYGIGAQVFPTGFKFPLCSRTPDRFHAPSPAGDCHAPAPRSAGTRIWLSGLWPLCCSWSVQAGFSWRGRQSYDCWPKHDLHPFLFSSSGRPLSIPPSLLWSGSWLGFGL